MNNHKVPAPAPAALLPVARREPERSESDRSATGSNAGSELKAHPDPEVVVAQAKRRSFTADYKQRILAEADHQRLRRHRRTAAPRRIVFVFVDYLEARARLRRPPSPGSPKAGATVQARSHPGRNSKAAEGQRASHGTTAQSRDRHRCSKKSGRAVGVADPHSRPGREALMNAVDQLAPTVGIESACDALGVARASFYRQPVFGPVLPVPVILRPAPDRKSTR